ncbi:MAG: DUF3078 domain-containing protein [FCB group bacterium]|nr:DUF3078 domain-containing protein [FCB group bacterium]
MKTNSRIILTAILAGIFTIPVSAGEDAAAAPGWEKTAVGTLNFTQNSFDNWSQGGEDAWTWMLTINAGFNRSAEAYTWNNSVKIAYGNTKVGSEGSRKAADEISLESVYTRLMGTTINPYIAGTAKTQFSKGYNYGDAPDPAISDFSWIRDISRRVLAWGLNPMGKSKPGWVRQSKRRFQKIMGMRMTRIRQKLKPQK